MNTVSTITPVAPTVGTGNVLADEIHALLIKHRDGMPVRSIQRQLGVLSPREEGNRRAVWKISEALALLVRQGWVRYEVTVHGLWYVAKGV